MRIARLAIGSATVLLACACGASPAMQEMQSVLGVGGTAGSAGQTAAAAPAAGTSGSVAKTAGAAAPTTVGTAMPTTVAMPATAAGQGGSVGAAGTVAVTGDTDEDGVPDVMDNCPMLANAKQTDSDADTRGDACDNCAGLPNPEQADADANGEGDACACDMPAVPCVDGKAGPYPCSGVDMLGRIPLADVMARSGASIWAPQSRRTTARSRSWLWTRALRLSTSRSHVARPSWAFCQRLVPVRHGAKLGQWATTRSSSQKPKITAYRSST